MFLSATISKNSVTKNLLKKEEKEEEKKQTLYVFQLSLEDIITPDLSHVLLNLLCHKVSKNVPGLHTQDPH